MANYNPYGPHVLGQEWVPIREETETFVAGNPDHFRGQQITLTANYTVNEARFYVPEPLAGTGFTHVGQTASLEVYPAGQEALSGPIRRVLIPCNASSTTGSGADIFLNNATSIASAFSNADDTGTLSVMYRATYGTAPGFTAYFSGAAFANVLNGRRILAINVLYAFRNFGAVETLTRQLLQQAGLNMQLASDAQNYFLGGGNAVPRYDTTVPATQSVVIGAVPATLFRVALPGFNPFWNGTTSPANGEVLPWVPADLARFEATAANRYGIRVGYFASGLGGAASSETQWGYMALEVLYCDEARVLVGGTVSPVMWTSTNSIVIRNMARAANPTIGPGAFTVAMRPFHLASGYYPNLVNPNLQASTLRHLYPLPTVAGTLTRVPYPYTDLSVVGKTFTAEPTDIVPQFTIHQPGGIVPDAHPYGLQARAEVWGSVTATQEIRDDVDTGTNPYSQVRFMARRYGSTTVPLVLSSAVFPASTAQITPNEFDVLPEVIDGWKEVTLRFGTPAAMGGGSLPQWRWTAAGEMAVNRWEVLGASAIAVSGVPGNNWGTPAVYALGTATYGEPASGTIVNLGWVPGWAPMVSATTDDPASDAFVIFSTEPASGTISVGTGSTALVVSDPNCPPQVAGCVPRSMDNKRITWTLLAGASLDTFTRTVAAGSWGATDVGQVWTLDGTAANYLVNGTQGVHSHPAAAATSMASIIDVNTPDQEVLFDFSADALDTTGLVIGVQLRRTDNNNYYRPQVILSSTGAVDFSINKRVAGVLSTVTSYTVPGLQWAVPTVFHMRARVSGNQVMARIWMDTQPEPPVWMVMATDNSLLTGNQLALISADTNAGGGVINVFFDHFTAQSSDFGAIELQRYDSVDAQFTTIMLSSQAAVTGFTDWEYRIGVPPVYRWRTRNVYDFAGVWSPQVTGTSTAPGVVGATVGLLMLSSNYRQDGSRVLAYSSAWDGNPQEDFAWPEGQQTVFQPMYDKNFPTAFRPIERGGETFSRNVLINALGIPAAARANGFKSIRDMAWDQLPYVCVRDELGNRWYATIMVPQGNRKRMVAAGHLNMAQVNVAEVTDTPFPVDPAVAP